MRKFLTLLAAIAVLALGSINEAKAGPSFAGLGGEASGGSWASTTGASVAVVAVGSMWVYTLGNAVYECATGKYDCTKSKVASAGELQSDRMAAAGIDTSKARYTAQAVDIGAANRAQSVHSYNLAMGYSDDADTIKNLASAGR